MAIQTISYLKTKFETGDLPTQGDFIDLIDTLNNPLPETVVQTATDGVLTVANNILPSANSTLDIGSPTARFKTIYVDEAKLSTNTLYIGDTPVLGTNADTIEVKADPDQSILVKTSGTGETGIQSVAGVNISTSGSSADVNIVTTGVGSLARLTSGTKAVITAPDIELTGSVVSSSNHSVGGNLTVTGNLTVNGTQTTVNSTSVSTVDNIITLNKGEVGTGVTSGFAGIQVDRGEAADYQMVFNEMIDMFQVGMVGSLETIASQNFVAANYTPFSHIGAGGSAHNNATTSVSGFMSSADKTKLDGVAAGAQVNTITSVAGRTGVVTLAKADVGLDQVSNTADADKPVSTATQTALNLKAPLASPTFTGTVAGITKTMVGLGSVDNTTDLAKPVSTATQTVLDLKANLASPTFTGTVAGITKTMVGLGSVDNTADAAKNVLSATKLTTSRTINGVAFDGTANITITAADATKLPLTGGTMAGNIVIPGAYAMVLVDTATGTNYKVQITNGQLVTTEI